MKLNGNDGLLGECMIEEEKEEDDSDRESCK